MKNNKINVSIPISNLDFWKGDIQNLPPNQNYELIIDYPVEKPVLFTINTGKNGMGFMAISNQIGKSYNHIYSNVKKYGVWGHCIEDLQLVEIKIDYDKNKITLSVDS